MLEGTSTAIYMGMSTQYLPPHTQEEMETLLLDLHQRKNAVEDLIRCLETYAESGCWSKALPIGPGTSLPLAAQRLVS